MTEKKHQRLMFAALFLFVLLAEWGSHVVVHARPLHKHDPSLTAHDGGHEDPCKYLILCCDKRRSDRQAPNSGHQLVQGAVVEISRFVPTVELSVDPPILFKHEEGLFRESVPPFQPPKIS